MKKTFILAAAVAMIAMTSCKKEYECCYYDADGQKIEFGGQGCVTAEYSKSDKEDAEDEANSALSNAGMDDLEFKCN